MYKTRLRATQFLAEQGLPVSAKTLGHMASRGEGPPYAVINGRAVYRVDELERWVTEAVDRNTRRRA